MSTGTLHVRMSLLGGLGCSPADTTTGFVLRPQARTQLEVSLFQSGLRMPSQPMLRLKLSSRPTLQS